MRYADEKPGEERKKGGRRGEEEGKEKRRGWRLQAKQGNVRRARREMPRQG